MVGDKKTSDEDKKVAHDTLCAFRLLDDEETGLALNCEPAPPNTMLNSDLLDKLVRRVKGVLGGSGAAGAAGAGEAPSSDEVVELRAQLANKDG